jgi:hypothetical protein
MGLFGLFRTKRPFGEVGSIAAAGRRHSVGAHFMGHLVAVILRREHVYCHRNTMEPGVIVMLRVAGVVRDGRRSPEPGACAGANPSTSRPSSLPARAPRHRDPVPGRLARQRISVLFAMLRDGTFYEPRRPQAAAA